jgi:hypothetical protein
MMPRRIITTLNLGDIVPNMHFHVKKNSLVSSTVIEKSEDTSLETGITPWRTVKE